LQLSLQAGSTEVRSAESWLLGPGKFAENAFRLLAIRNVGQKHSS
jgi:hypothetical protein